MEKYTEEFANKEIVTSRQEVAEVMAHATNSIVETMGSDISEKEKGYFRAILTAYGAMVLLELFDDTLEVE